MSSKIKSNSKTHKYKTHTIYKKNKGSDLRQELVTLCKNNKWSEYDNLTNEILNDYIYGKNDIFIHLYKKFDTFSNQTKLCLLRFLTRAQEEAIPESMKYLELVMLLNNNISKNTSGGRGRRINKRINTITKKRKRINYNKTHNKRK